MQLKAEAATCKYSYRKHGYNYFYLNGAVSLPILLVILNKVSLPNIFEKEETT